MEHKPGCPKHLEGRMNLPAGVSFDTPCTCGAEPFKPYEVEYPHLRRDPIFEASAELRYVMRDGEKVLQQWWRNTNAVYLSGVWGEWRDVPMADDAEQYPGKESSNG